jgi:hypothetical protein
VDSSVEHKVKSKLRKKGRRNISSDIRGSDRRIKQIWKGKKTNFMST